jgi:hypothetical protein
MKRRLRDCIGVDRHYRAMVTGMLPNTGDINGKARDFRLFHEDVALPSPRGAGN